MNPFSMFRRRAKEDAKTTQKEQMARLEAFLGEVQKLESAYGCEIQARLQYTSTGVAPVVHAVVLNKPQPANAKPAEQPTSNSPTISGGTPSVEAGQDAPAQSSGNPQVPAQP